MFRIILFFLASCVEVRKPNPLSAETDCSYNSFSKFSFDTCTNNIMYCFLLAEGDCLPSVLEGIGNPIINRVGAKRRSRITRPNEM